jgi:hypothetical protein
MTDRSLPLHLDDRSLILAQKDVLYVFNRRGAFDLRGKDIEALHARLAPHLQGTQCEEALLAAVPPASAGPLLSYFDKLRQVGALRTATEPTGPAGDATLPLDELGPARWRGQFAWREHCVEISLNGPWPAPRTERVARLEFLDPQDAGRWLCQLRAPGCGLGNQACVVETPVAETISAEVLRRRASYARWLLGSGFDVERRERALLFELDAQSGELRRRVVLDDDGPAHALRTLPDQIEILRSDGINQLPLVVARAAHPFFAPEVRRIGLDKATVRKHLLRDFLMQVDQGAAEPEPGSTAPLVAGSRCELAILLLEREAERRAACEELRWTEVDLLAQEELHPEIRYLQSILRLRQRALPARRAVTHDGAVSFELGSHHALSFVPARAVAEILLGVTWELFYGPSGGEAPRPALDLRSFAEPAELLRIAARLRRRPSARSTPGLRAVRRWGMTAWTEEQLHETP